MKRIISLLILLFMVGSVFIPFFMKIKQSQTLQEEYIEPTEKIVAENKSEELAKDSYTINIEEMQSKISDIDTIEDKLDWYIAYKSIIEEYSGVLDPPESVYDYFTDDEIYLMQRTIETECYGCDFLPKVNVANVILNRIYDGETFGKSVESVITSPNQFDYSRKTISNDTVLALEYAFQIEDSTDGCIAFHSNSKKERFGRWGYSFTDTAGHHFYK